MSLARFSILQRALCVVCVAADYVPFFGPPVRSEGGLGVCELCYHGASDQQIAACEMRLILTTWRRSFSRNWRGPAALRAARSSRSPWRIEPSF